MNWVFHFDIDNKKIKIDELEKEIAYIYFLMNNGYSYQEKIIKKNNVTDLEIAAIYDNLEKLKGFYVKYDWERVYLYGDTFKNILGSVNSIPKEKKDEYIRYKIRNNN